MNTGITEFKVLSPTAILGYGFPEESFKRGIEMQPDLIAVDAGSVDPGPYYLGSGKPFTNRDGVKRDLRYILKAAYDLDIPAVIGTAGGSGARPHVDWCRKIIEEIAEEDNLSFTMGVIYADVDKELIKSAIKAGRTRPLGGLPDLDSETVDKATNIVAQMGLGPIKNALDLGSQVVLAGRAYDPTAFAAKPIALGFDPALALHMGKILECAAIAATPGSGCDCVMGILREEHFELVPLSPVREFTKNSTAAHSLYEKSDPLYLPGPGGMLDLNEVKFEEMPEGRIKVSGTRFIPEENPTIKLEGAEKVGCRTISIAGTRDPIMIGQIDSILETVKTNAMSMLKSEGVKGDIFFHVYGKNGVMAELETETMHSDEVCVLIETLAANQKDADAICSIVRSTLLHYGYPGRIATAGNMAFPFSPSDISAGDVYKFSIYHLLEIDENDIFKTEIHEL
ncbi:acyclic terpene utilization AtuA family protein [Lentisphaerota bacterium]|nr:acyclic terpene utilization AtuA family protein [Lentisphaerota bacterium]